MIFIPLEANLCFNFEHPDINFEIHYHLERYFYVFKIMLGQKNTIFTVSTLVLLYWFLPLEYMNIVNYI